MKIANLLPFKRLISIGFASVPKRHPGFTVASSRDSEDFMESSLTLGELKKKVDRYGEKFQALKSELARVIVGQDEIVESVLLALVAGGHVLIEGAPGLGKTLLVRTLGEAMDLKFARVQFTPDLMPADIVGTNIIVEDERGQKSFRFQQGPVFTNLLLADEINRATPKTQSALLEAM